MEGGDGGVGWVSGGGLTAEKKFLFSFLKSAVGPGRNGVEESFPVASVPGAWLPNSAAQL